MCQAMKENGAFDPAFCPLLKGLSPEVAAERMKDQVFANCRASPDSGKSPVAGKSGRRPDCLLDSQLEEA